MTINQLTAQDAISSSVIHVSADMRLRDLNPRTGLPRGEIYAVFSELADEDVSREFLGLVSNDSVGRYPCRIFADLLSLSKSLPVDPSAPLDVLYSNFEQDRLDACMVMETGDRFMGAVTYSSLLKTLWRREQLLTARLQQEIGDKILLERQLQRSQQTLDEYFCKEADGLVEYQQQIVNLAQCLKSAEQRERSILAMELHDHLAQILAVAKMKLAQGPRLTQNPELVNLLNMVDHLLQESLTYTRTLITDLNSAHLQQRGLLAALEHLKEKMKQFNLQVIIEAEPPMPELTEDQQLHVYSSIRELLFNIVKHAQADHARILIQKAAGSMLQFIISDAGKGFEPEKAGMAHSREHFGLSGMQGRMAAIQGNVTIHSSPGQGTRVILSIPLPPSSPPDVDSTGSQGSR